MKFRQITGAIVLVENDTPCPVITDVQSALDLIATARYEYGDTKIMIKKEDVIETFFDLKTRIAGEILQKFVNYNTPLAIIGDFSGYQSESLKDFIYESNKGRSVLFVETQEQAVQKLCSPTGD